MQHRPVVQTGGCKFIPALMKGKIHFSHLFPLDRIGRKREFRGMPLESRVLLAQITQSSNNVKP